MKRTARLRNRLLLSMSALVFATAAVFSLYTLAFTYGVEDAFLISRLQEEASYQSAEYANTGTWSSPRDARLKLHASIDSLPAPVRERLSEEPRRIEFPGPAGSHYHLLPVNAPDGTRAWLLYDAGDDLLVPAIRNKLLVLLAITAGLLLICALAVGYLVSRRITRRLEALAAGLRDFSPGQGTPPLLQADGNDEVGIVAASLHAMSERLQTLVKRERRFTRDASHELRTPLTVIRSASEQLERQPDLSAVSRAHAARVRESSIQLERTVTTLLAMAREDASDGAGESTVLLPLIEQTVIEQSTRLDGKPITVEVEVDPAACLQAPETVTRILLANLIGNAFAHTAAGRVRIETAGSTVRIINANTGAFSIEEQAPCPGSTSGEGFGFGLDIVRRLAERFDLAFSLLATPTHVTATLTLAEPGNLRPAHR